MQLIIATSNKGKLREIQQIMNPLDTLPYTDLIPAMEIIEDGSTFQANAIIKARAIYDALGNQEAVILADDSGISVPVLDHAPGIYSARYAGPGASDKDNLYKLIDAIKEKGISRTPAYYTSAIAIATKRGIFTVHGWMHGHAIDRAIGENGFGYDPMFIPLGFDQTLGELKDFVKETFSHRGKALSLAHTLLRSMLIPAVSEETRSNGEQFGFQTA